MRNNAETGKSISSLAPHINLIVLTCDGGSQCRNAPILPIKSNQDTSQQSFSRAVLFLISRILISGAAGRGSCWLAGAG